jgi:hypothetical protein
MRLWMVITGNRSYPKSKKFSRGSTSGKTPAPMVVIEKD